jgi:hypothetical protein
MDIQPTLEGERVIGSRTDAFSTQFTGFSICHPMYDDKHMLKVVNHATASALSNQEAIATFLLLPNWMQKQHQQNLHWQHGSLLIPKKKCAACHSSTSNAEHHPYQKQYGAYAS